MTWLHSINIFFCDVYSKCVHFLKWEFSFSSPANVFILYFSILWCQLTILTVPTIRAYDPCVKPFQYVFTVSGSASLQTICKGQRRPMEVMTELIDEKGKLWLVVDFLTCLFLAITVCRFVDCCLFLAMTMLNFVDWCLFLAMTVCKIMLTVVCF